MFYRIEQYKDAQNLNARIALHEKYSSNPQNFHKWVFLQFSLSSGQKVLECGCGPGTLWSKNRATIPIHLDITLVDLSTGMLDEARKTIGELPDINITYLPGDIQQLNFDDETFDLVIANHMLYHVPDITKGLVEAKRVLKPGGRFFASTFSRNHLRELNRLTELYVKLPKERTSDRFCLENGYKLVKDVFLNVELRKHDDSLVVTNPDDLIEYILSGTRAKKQLVGDKKDIFKREIYNRFLRESKMFIKKDAGVLLSVKE
ncbi:MAG: class I SAM-dependent methyltransferase [Chitinispirillaceae bacterium]|nr:class I SAM-dependent methyltransferase [Chitinispirillaceae bacterium]